MIMLMMMEPDLKPHLNILVRMYKVMKERNEIQTFQQNMRIQTPEGRILICIISYTR